MGIHQTTKIVETTNAQQTLARNSVLDNAIATAKIMSKPGWSDEAPRHSLPSVISVGPYATGMYHCGFRGIYPSPVTVETIAAHRLFESRSTTSMKRFDMLGRCEFVEVFAATEDQLKNLPQLPYDIYTEYGNFDVYGGINIEFFIGSDHTNKGAVELALEAASIPYETLSQDLKTFYAANSIPDANTWNTYYGTVWKFIVNFMCGQDSTIVHHQKLQPPP